jgi:hypothetical protein
MTFTKTSGTAHHAIEFGTNIPTTSITLRGCAFGPDFSASEHTSPTAEAGDETFAFRDTTGTLTVNLVGCTGNFGYYSAGVDVTVVVDPVTTLINVKDNNGNNLQDARVWLVAASGAGDLPYQQAITSISRSGTTATVTFTAAHGLVNGEYLKLAGITDKTEDNNGAFQISWSSTTVVTYQTTDSGSTSYTGTITGTGGTLYGLTDASGNISSQRTYTVDHPVEGFVRKSTQGIEASFDSDAFDIATPAFETDSFAFTTTTATVYKSFSLAGNTVDQENGLTINIRMVPDE